MAPLHRPRLDIRRRDTQSIPERVRLQVFSDKRKGKPSPRFCKDACTAEDAQLLSVAELHTASTKTRGSLLNDCPQANNSLGAKNGFQVIFVRVGPRLVGCHPQGGRPRSPRLQNFTPPPSSS